MKWQSDWDCKVEMKGHFYHVEKRSDGISAGYLLPVQSRDYY